MPFELHGLGDLHVAGTLGGANCGTNMSKGRLDVELRCDQQSKEMSRLGAATAEVVADVEVESDAAAAG